MFGPKIWDYYADRYDRLWVQRFVLNPSRRLILKTMGELPVSRRILDVGCGIGELCHSMSVQNPLALIVGIDPSVKMIQRAEEKFSGNNIRYICGHPDSLPENQKFDLIVSTNAFPYMPDKPKALLGMKMLLKPNGRLLLLFANRNTFYDALWLMFVKLTTSKADYLSVSSLHNLLKESGFEIGKTEPIESLFFVPSVFMVEGILPDSQLENEVISA
ncbi:MAG: class I SAM-dependent methyltransferase [Prolixibacteraceae bacterium]|nr:class I SAM-dependent methyltransferase [Prolixibacteraceae bacterium]